MAHYFEAGFSVRQPAWHGLATVLDDYPTDWADARAKASLTWEPVEETPYRLRPDTTYRTCLDCGVSLGGEHPDQCAVALDRDDRKVTLDDVLPFGTVATPAGLFVPDYDHKFVTRSDNGRVLGVHSSEYSTIFHGEAHAQQHRGASMEEIIDAFRNSDGGLKFETAGSARDGKAVWALLYLDEPYTTPGDESQTYPYLAVLNNHGGDGSAKAIASQVRVVCHAEGTMIDDHGWRGRVEDHYSAVAARVCSGRRVRVSGLPFTEDVTDEHLYWARLLPERRSDGAVILGTGEDARWVPANQLVPGRHEIGMPVDDTLEPAPSRTGLTHDDDPEWWWLAGLWWGDGNLHADTGITLTVADTATEVLARVQALYRRAGWTGKPIQRDGCVQLTLYDQGLNAFFAEWKIDNRPSMKVPPAWVERMPLDCQRQLVRGYLDADGKVDTTEGAIITSVSLDGLLALRRILLRLGIPSSIRVHSQGGPATILGRQVGTRPAWTIRFWRNAEQLGVKHRFVGRYSLPAVEDGWLWSRVRSVEIIEEGKFWPITTETEDYLTAFGRSHNCWNTFQMASAEGDRHGRQFTFRHVGDVAERIDEAKAAIAGIRDEVKEYQRLAGEMSALNVDDAQVLTFTEWFIPSPRDIGEKCSDRVHENVLKARSLFSSVYGESPTMDGIRGSKWGLLQAADEYLDHLRGFKSRDSYMGRTLLRAEPRKAQALTMIRGL